MNLFKFMILLLIIKELCYPISQLIPNTLLQEEREL